MDYGFELVGDDGIRFSGVQFGNEGSKHVWKIESRNLKENLVAVRFPSSKCWNGVGQPYRHVPPCVRVFRLDHKNMTVEQVICVDIGRVVRSKPVPLKIKSGPFIEWRSGRD